MAKTASVDVSAAIGVPVEKAHRALRATAARKVTVANKATVDLEVTVATVATVAAPGDDVMDVTDHVIAPLICPHPSSTSTS
jgi:hypothetical protein